LRGPSTPYSDRSSFPLICLCKPFPLTLSAAPSWEWSRRGKISMGVWGALGDMGMTGLPIACSIEGRPWGAVQARAQTEE
jgi:hypothetical protein